MLEEAADDGQLFLIFPRCRKPYGAGISTWHFAAY